MTKSRNIRNLQRKFQSDEHRQSQNVQQQTITTIEDEARQKSFYLMTNQTACQTEHFVWVVGSYCEVTTSGSDDPALTS